MVAQYYNFLRLGKEGYSDIMNNAMKNARYLSDKLKETGKFEIISKDDTIPIVVFRLLDTSVYDVFDLSHVLRTRGWIVPAYTMPPNAESVEVLRVVVRESFTRDLADILLNDMEEAIKLLTETDGKKPVVIGESVNHIC